MFITKEVKVLFFDMDGTLIDTVPSLFRAYCDVKHQLNQKPNRDEFEQLGGASIQEIAAALAPDTIASDQIAQRLIAARAHYLPKEAQLFDGVRHFLSRCRQCDLALWLVTSASAAIANQLLQHCEIASLFRGLITSNGLSFGKPHPEIYLKALSSAQVKADRALAFEDSMQGIASALSAQLPVVSFNFDVSVKRNRGDHQRLLAHFSSWIDIENWFFTSGGQHED